MWKSCLNIDSKVSSFERGVDVTIKAQSTLLADPISLIIWILSNKQMEIEGQKPAITLMMPLFPHLLTNNHASSFFLTNFTSDHETKIIICLYYARRLLIVSSLGIIWSSPTRPKIIY